MVEDSGSPLRPSAVFVKYLLSCAASAVAETATYPLDITKTRLQSLHGGARSQGMWRTMVDMTRREGVRSMWDGLVPAVYRHFLYTGIRLCVYESLRDVVRSDEHHFPVWRAMSCGVVSGAIAQFVASPMDLVKVQLQTQGIRKDAKRQRGTWHVLRSVYRHGGLGGLWLGWVPNCQRAALLNMADLATYDTVKHYLIDEMGIADGVVAHGAASACSGLAAATVSTPADVVKTRIMDQTKHPEKRKYRGSLDCLRSIVREEGFWTLYRGFVPIYIRMAPWSLTFWISYEQVRYLTGASSF